MTTPQLLSRKTTGVLAMPGAGQVSKPAKTKTTPEGEKVIIRRLPPGMTEDEFVEILGQEWASGRGKVGWLSFRAGKISHEWVVLFLLSRPACRDISPSLRENDEIDQFFTCYFQPFQVV